MKAVPGPLRMDRDRSGTERKRPGWPIVANELQGRGAIDNVNQLIAGEMGFPMTFSGELGDEQTAVAIRRQLCAAALSICRGRLRGAAAEHRKLRELGVEIDDARRSARYHFLRLCRPRV